MKNLKGGYKIVSLQQNDLTANFTLEGLYDAIKDSYNKTILVTEIVISGVHKNDAYTLVNKNGTSYVIEVYGKKLTITTADVVTVTNVSEGVTSIGGKEGDITLGSGLTISENKELSATGGGGSGYLHSIKISRSETDAYNIIINITLKESSPFSTMKSFIDYLYDNTENEFYIIGSGIVNGFGTVKWINCSLPKSETSFNVRLSQNLTSYLMVSKDLPYSEIGTFTDTVLNI